jgi:protein-S-isoprenylcysteine O-methyltransferase Ste14
MKTSLVVLRAAVYAVVFFSFFAWLALRVQRLDSKLAWPLPRATELPGVALLLLGGVLMLWCVWLFVVRGRGTPAPFDAPRELVALGPYRYSRNPIYLAGLCMWIGWGLLERSISVLLVAPVLFAVVHLLVVLYEEPTLRRSFGNSYLDYCQRVPRWIGRRA